MLLCDTGTSFPLPHLLVVYFLDTESKRRSVSISLPKEGDVENAQKVQEAREIVEWCLQT
jgi:hypothetical protein